MVFKIKQRVRNRRVVQSITQGGSKFCLHGVHVFTRSTSSRTRNVDLVFLTKENCLYFRSNCLVAIAWYFSLTYCTKNVLLLIFTYLIIHVNLLYDKKNGYLHDFKVFSFLTFEIFPCHLSLLNHFCLILAPE